MVKNPPVKLGVVGCGGPAHLADCVRTGKEPPATGEHAGHVVELIVAAGRAARTGRTQTLRTTF